MWIAEPGERLSHSHNARSRAEPAAVGSGAPCIDADGPIPAMSQNVGARSRCPTGSATSRGEAFAERAGRAPVAGGDVRRARRPPHERHAHQRIRVERALEQEAVVALELTVVGGEE